MEQQTGRNLADHYQSPENFKGGDIWNVIASIHGALQAIGYAPSGVVFRGRRGKDLRKFYRSEKAGTTH